MEEDKRLGSFMDGFLQRQSCEELCNDDAHGSGRGSNLTFLSNDTQNKIVLIISQLITEKIVKALQECRAWALIVDTTADIAHQEQL